MASHSVNNIFYVTVSWWTLHCCFSLLTAPPLTLENVLPVVKGVRSWRTLAKQLVYAYDHDDIYSYGIDLDDLQHQHGSDENCLKAVIEKFLLGKDLYWQPSWRTVIWSLYKANELHLANQIRSFTEPLQGVCICAYTCAHKRSHVLHM